MSNILDELTAECPFPEVFTDYEDENAAVKVYRRKIGHIRADYSYMWYNSIWPVHPEITTKEMEHEIDDVYSRLIARDAFKNLFEMRQFCRLHSEAKAEGNSNDEYNFYYVGEHCFYWIRCITRERDYNIYLNAFTKE